MMNSINLKNTLLPTLDFWFAHDSTHADKLDRVEVQISSNGYSFNTIQTINRYNANFANPGWQKYTVDLSNYTSETCVIIAFRAISAGGGNMWIDRIAINSAKEMSVLLDIPKEEDLMACELDHKELKVKISNNTLLPIDFDQIPVILTLNISGAKTLSYKDTLTGILNGNAEMDIVLDSDFDFSLNGTYNFRAYISNIDNLPDNDTATSSIVISPDIYLVSLDSIGTRSIKEYVYPSVLLRNTGNLTIKEIPIRIKVNGGNDVTETAYIELAAGNDTLYTLNTPYVVPLEPTYDLMIITELICDPVKNNDTLRSTENVNEPAIKIQNIISPSSSICDSGLTEIYPQVVINNTGNPDIDVVIHISMDTASHVFASLVDTIAFVLSGTTTYNFTKSYIVPNMPTNSIYNVKAYIYSPTYTYSQTACVILKEEEDNVSTLSKDNWTLGQNIPNPAQSSLVIPYTVPREGDVIFKIMSINGQVLYYNIMHVLKGNHQIEHNIASFADGIYYYSMEYEGERIIKKMTIQK
ncbi:MAG: T9SS type A sorting domain-containing protein [Bacteroidales bacterium]|nr:T9SS type A sorting domain-containing protein [Bacteroidales bacterium]